MTANTFYALRSDKFLFEKVTRRTGLSNQKLSVLGIYEKHKKVQIPSGGLSSRSTSFARNDHQSFCLHNFTTPLAKLLASPISLHHSVPESVSRGWNHVGGISFRERNNTLKAIRCYSSLCEQIAAAASTWASAFVDVRRRMTR